MSDVLRQYELRKQNYCQCYPRSTLVVKSQPALGIRVHNHKQPTAAHLFSRNDCRGSTLRGCSTYTKRRVYTGCNSCCDSRSPSGTYTASNPCNDAGFNTSADRRPYIGFDSCTNACNDAVSGTRANNCIYIGSISFYGFSSSCIFTSSNI